MSSSSPPPPPDYTPIANASKEASAEQTALAQEQFDWAKQQYAENKGVTDKVVGDFLNTQDQNFANAQADRERYVSKYQPLEDSLINEANDYASPTRKDQAMGSAAATAAQQAQAQRVNAARDLESFGINPGATRFAALDIGARAAQGASEAGAANMASRDVDNTARQLRSEAINVGRGYPAQVAGATNTGLQAGTGAVNNTNTTTQVGGQTMGTAPQYFAGSNQALNTWGNTLNQGYSNALASYNASQNSSSGLGSALGLGAAMLFAADGGAIDDTPGGAVPVDASPTGGKAVDDVPAALTVGEFVMPKDYVAWVGEKKLHDSIIKAREERAELKAQSGAVPKVRPAATQRPAGALPVMRRAA